MSFTYAPFKAIGQLSAAANNAPALRVGSRGPGVALMQAGLATLGYKLPRSISSEGVPDGAFGAETKARVEDFQASQSLKKDGIAGKNTLLRLDRLLSAKTTPPPFKPDAPAPPPPPSTDHYELGRGDPAIKPDPGAGVWRSKPAEPAYVALKAAVFSVLPSAYLLVGEDAVKHMLHYFHNKGSDYLIATEAMLKDVPRARARFDMEVRQAVEFVEMLPLGTHHIRSKRAETSYNVPSQSRNWYYAIGGYMSWGSGTARVTEKAGERVYAMDFVYDVFDRYNWDNGKSVELFGITITDEFMGEFHRQGLAHEYNCRGRVQRRLTWTQGQTVPQAQLEPPQTVRM